jgi:uncharacterized protein (TIGR02265 family)
MPLAPEEVVPVESWVIFAPGAESLRAAIGKNLTPHLAAQLKANGLDYDKPLQAAYPAPQFEAWVRLAAQALFPDATLGEAQRQLGQRFFDGWQGTLTGAAVSTFLRLIGPRRALNRVGQAFRNGNNFTVTRATFQEGNDVLIDFVQTQNLADFVRGNLEAALGLMHVKGEVTIVSRGSREFVLRVTWTD